MTFARRSGGGWAAPSTVKRMSGGAWADVQNIYRRTGGTWVLAWKKYTPVSGTITPGQANGSLTSASGASGVPVSNTVTAQGANGNGSYTYNWRIGSVSDGGALPNISNANAQAVTISRIVTNNTGTINGTLICTISDGTSAVDVSVPYNLSYSNRN